MRDAILYAKGRKAVGLACISGALWALAFAPFHALPVAYLAFAPIGIWIARFPSSSRRIGLLTLLWGFCGHLAGIYWVAYAIYLSFGKTFAGAMIGGSIMLGLCLLLSSLLLLAVGMSACARAPLVRILLFVCGFAFSEWLRGVAFSGFPWNLTGHSWNASLLLLQSNALGGIHLTSLLALLSLGLSALLAESAFGNWSKRGVLRRVSLYAAAALAVPLCAALYGAWRLPPMVESDASPVVRMVQPNIVQSEKWEAKRALQNFTTLVRLSTQDRASSVRLVIWPETAYPYTLDMEEKNTLSHLKSLASTYLGSDLLLGAVRTAKHRGEPRLFNSLVLIEQGGAQSVSLYDKRHLVPLGEYIPLLDFFPTLSKRVRTLTSFPSFVAGEQSPVLTLAGLPPMEVAICYELIFPRLTPRLRPSKHDREVGLLVQATNDGWFGKSSGPYQHLQLTRVRAVERGVGLLRVANTGVSAVFDSYGRERARLPLDAEGWIDSALPAKIETDFPVRRLGDSLFWLALSLGLLASWLIERSVKRANVFKIDTRSKQ